MPSRGAVHACNAVVVDITQTSATSHDDALHGSIRKIERAAHHLQVLTESVVEFRGRKTYTIEPVGNLRDDLARHVEVEYVYSELEQFPDNWSAILADLLNNLRSALDHAVWEVAVRNVGSEPANPTAICFPICATVEDFDRQCKRALGSLTAAQIERVRSVQPFSDPPPAGLSIEDHPLLMLHHLNRIDKHRTLHIVRRWAESFTVVFDPEPPDFSVHYPDIPELVDGAVLASVRFLRPPPNIARLGLPLVQTIAHTETIAATSYTPEVPLGSVVKAMYRWTLDAVFALLPDVESEVDQQS